MAALASNTSRHKWLTSEFLENILKSSESSENVKVIDFVLYDAVPKGENYLSCLMRATINYCINDSGPKQKSFVIKTLLESDVMNEKLKKSGFFDKEIAFYRDIVPKFKTYTDIIDKDFMCAPRCYATSVNPPFLVFEDLKEQNYCNIDRRIGLDFTVTAMLLQKLAKLHAINAMLYDESPELFQPHKVQIVSRDNDEFVAAYTNGMEDIKRLCLNWPGYEHFHDKFDSLLSDPLAISEKVYSQCENSFNTLTHGDVWCNNVMFQFDEANNPVDVRMVDFQFGFYGSPAIDIGYLFFSSTVNELEEEDWDRLLQIYHTELVATLKLVKYSNDRIPSLTEIQIQMLEKSLVGVVISLSAVAMRHLSSDIQPDIDTLLFDDGKDVRLALYDKPVIYKRIQYLLDFFNRKGFF